MRDRIFQETIALAQICTDCAEFFVFGYEYQTLLGQNEWVIYGVLSYANNRAPQTIIDRIKFPICLKNVHAFCPDFLTCCCCLINVFPVFGWQFACFPFSLRFVFVCFLVFVQTNHFVTERLFKELYLLYIF